MKTYHHIFFDLDRTLWNFQKNSSETLKDILEKFSLYKVINNEADFIEKYNYFNDHLWDNFKAGKIKKPELRKERFRLLMEAYGITDEDLIGKISRYYLNYAPLKKALIPGTGDILKYLSGKYKLYIISNGFYDVQLSKMISSGISRYFIKTFTSDRIGIAKPRSGIFNYALSSVNARKAESLMVGDDAINDVHGAHHAKIDQVFLNPEGKPCQIPPTYEIKELIELKDIL
jgi:putative hydrolase of the HAD superfamily